ncbi:MAG: hypothetical protein WKF92_11605 [Pyrinomonadaceae bacterium]
MKPFIKLILALAPLIAVAAGCGKLIPGGSANLFEGENAATAAAAIKQKIGAEKVNVIRAEMQPDKLKIQIQSPTNPKDVDEYTYEHGTVSGPEPVQVFLGRTAEKHHMAEIGEINFAVLPRTIERAIQLAGSEGAKVDMISMDQHYAATANPTLKGTPEGSKWALTWRIFVQGTRVQKSFWADQKGNLNEKPL